MKYPLKHLPPKLEKIVVVLSEKYAVKFFEKRLRSEFFAVCPCGCTRILVQSLKQIMKNFFFPICQFCRRAFRNLLSVLCSAPFFFSFPGIYFLLSISRQSWQKLFNNQVTCKILIYTLTNSTIILT